MKTVFNRVKKSILIYTILYTVIFAISHLVLNAFGMNYREGIYFFSAFLIAIGTIIGIIQLLCKIKNKYVKVILIIVFIMTLIPCSLYAFILGIFAYSPEHVVIKNGKKMIAYVNGFMDTYVEYYDYKNFLFVGNKIRIKEYYGNGGFDPIENKYGYNYPIISTSYYDDEGKIIRTEEEASK